MDLDPAADASFKREILLAELPFQVTFLAEDHAEMEDQRQRHREQKHDRVVEQKGDSQNNNQEGKNRW